MANETSTASPSLDQKAGIQAVVEPVRAGGALLGFAAGFLAAHRSGADVTTSALHGLVGAALLFLLAWYLALVLVRELMTQHVEEQRRLYAERVEQLQAAQGEAAEAMGALAKTVPQAVLGPPPAS